MDLSLPVLDGWEATRQLKARREPGRSRSSPCRRTRCPGDRERRVEAGCDDYDTKPVRSRSLMAKIRALLPRRRLTP